MSHDEPPLPTYQAYPTTPPPVGPPGEIHVVSLGETPRPRPRRRGRVVVALVAAAALVAGAVALPLSLVAGDEPVDLSEVAVYEDLRSDHVVGDTSYPTVPPAGGPHDEVWLDCGVYDEPVRDENAVHDLEHGTIWITYRPDLSDGDVAALVDALPQNGILSPYDDLPAPVVVTVWGRQLRLDGADDERLALFVEEYAGGVTAPEPGASCAGGVRSPTGGTGTPV